MQEIENHDILEISDLRNSSEFLHVILNNLHSSIFILTKDRIIKDANQSGIALLNRDEETIFNNIFGNALDCMHTEEGKLECGFTPACKDCKLKQSCEQVYNNHSSLITSVFDQKGMIKDNQRFDKSFLYTAKQVKYKGESMVLLIVDDITRLENQKKVIENQKAEIESSLQYAINIQNAILPRDEKLKDVLNEYFLLYEPKDFIGGDFYWAFEKDNKALIAVGDCTGHGVPGAMLTVLGITTLNDIVKTRDIESPDIILNILRENFIDALNQNSETKISDGMDISLCLIDKEKMKLHFAGANNKICLIQDEMNHELKGDKMPIGLFDTNRHFTTQSINYEKGDMLYIYTDGFKDQFGGPKDKKIGKKRYHNLLNEIQAYDINTQKEYLYQFYANWKSDKEQTDDMTVMGIKLE